MSEYRKQAAFLKALMSYDESSEHQPLLERLAQAENNERCLIGACWLVGLIALFGLAGLGYSAVLLDQFFDGSPHVLLRIFGALGLGAALCLVFFIALWFWYRNAVNRIHQECRQVVTRMVASRLRPAPAPVFSPVVFEALEITVLPGSRVTSHAEPLPKAG
jgi:formate hydrogenlyase subunit 3/multisubunit Na+/H+ antiporter MnhD subunit